MHIAIGSDHAGFQYKERIRVLLTAWGHDVTDFGTDSPEPVDYPLVIRPVAEAIARGEFERGIVLGGSGNGEAIVGGVHGFVDIFARAPALVRAGEIVALSLVEELGDGAALAVDADAIMAVLDGIATGLEVTGRDAFLQVEEGVAHRRDDAGNAADLGIGTRATPGAAAIEEGIEHADRGGAATRLGDLLDPR